MGSCSSTPLPPPALNGSRQVPKASPPLTKSESMPVEPLTPPATVEIVGDTVEVIDPSSALPPPAPNQELAIVYPPKRTEALLGSEEPEPVAERTVPPPPPPKERVVPAPVIKKPSAEEIQKAKALVIARKAATVAKEVEEAAIAAATEAAALAATQRKARDTAFAAANAAKEASAAALTATREELSSKLASDPFSISRVFALYDTDKSGTISVAELSSALTALMGRSPSPIKLQSLITKYDTNNDGKFGVTEVEDMVKDKIFEPASKGVFSRNKSYEEEERAELVRLESEKEAVASALEELRVLELRVKLAEEAEALDVAAKLAKEEEDRTEVGRINAEVAKKEAKKQANLLTRVLTDIEAGLWSPARVFQAFDADGDRLLSVSELQLALTSLLNREISPTQSRAYLTKFDADRSGQLDFDEFESLVSYAKSDVGGFLMGIFSDKVKVKKATEEIEKNERGEAEIVIPLTMQAWLAYGANDDPSISVNDMKLVSVPTPTPSATQILVKTKAASINPIDFKILTTGYQGEGMFPTVFPWTLGFDCSGVVVACGESVTKFKVGDEIAVDLGLAETCGAGKDVPPGGAFAEYFISPESLVSKKPSSIPYTSAAGLPLAGLTALQALVEQGNFTAGQKVLVLGGSAATGTYALQIAKNCLDAGETWTTASSNKTRDGVSKIQYCKGLGVQVIDYKEANWFDVLAGKEFDLIFDCVGIATDVEHASKVLKKGGIFVSIANFGAASTADFTFKAFIVASKSSDLTQLLTWADEKKLVVPIDSIIGISDVKAGLLKSIQSDVSGKIVIKF